MKKIWALAMMAGCAVRGQQSPHTPSEVEAELERQLHGVLDKREARGEISRPPERPSGESVSVYRLQHKVSKATGKSYLRARKMSKSGDHAGAATELESTIQMDPLFAGAYNQLGAEYGQLGRVWEARRAFERAVELDPDSWGHHFNLGLALFQLGDPPGAERSARRALQLASEEAEPHWLLGYLLYTNAGTRSEGLEHLRYAARTIKEAKKFLQITGEK